MSVTRRQVFRLSDGDCAVEETSTEILGANSEARESHDKEEAFERHMSRYKLCWQSVLRVDSRKQKALAASVTSSIRSYDAQKSGTVIQ